MSSSSVQGIFSRSGFAKSRNTQARSIARVKRTQYASLALRRMVSLVTNWQHWQAHTAAQLARALPAYPIINMAGRAGRSRVPTPHRERMSCCASGGEYAPPDTLEAQGLSLKQSRPGFRPSRFEACSWIFLDKHDRGFLSPSGLEAGWEAAGQVEKHLHLQSNGNTLSSTDTSCLPWTLHSYGRHLVWL